jgi:DNA-binding transcriptional MerR regulator
MELVSKIISNSDEVKIATLSDELTISQVVKFFEKQGRTFTKTMIQNYVRVGVLPPPIGKRYYTRNHLILLTLIDSLKNAYSLEEIKMILGPIRNNPEIFEDDMMKTMDIYKGYLEMRKEALARWEDSVPKLFDRVEKLVDEEGVRKEDKKAATQFMIVLTIMAESIAMKDLVNEVIKEYYSK